MIRTGDAPDDTNCGHVRAKNVTFTGNKLINSPIIMGKDPMYLTGTCHDGTIRDPEDISLSDNVIAFDNSDPEVMELFLW